MKDFRRTEKGVLPKWLNLHNIAAVSYYAYALCSSLETMINGGDLPIPQNLEKGLDNGN